MVKYQRSLQNTNILRTCLRSVNMFHYTQADCQAAYPQVSLILSEQSCSWATYLLTPRSQHLSLHPDPRSSKSSRPEEAEPPAWGHHFLDKIEGRDSWLGIQHLHRSKKSFRARTLFQGDKTAVWSPMTSDILGEGILTFAIRL